MKLQKLKFVFAAGFMLLALSAIPYATGHEQADSLIRLMQTENNPAGKAKLYFGIAEILTDSAPGLALDYYDSARRIVETLKNPALQMEILYRMGSLSKTLINTDTALILFKNSAILGEATGDSVFLAKAYLMTAKTFYLESQLDSATLFCKKSLNFTHTKQQQKNRVRAFNTLGNIYLDRFMYDSAAYYYLETLRLSEIMKFNAGISASLINLGKTHMAIRENEKAKTYFLQSIEYNQKHDHTYFLALAYTNLGSIEHSDSNYIKSLDYYEQATDLQKQIHNEVGLYNLYHNIGNVYRDKKEIGTSLKYYDKALKGFIRIGDTAGIMNTIMNKATALYHDGKMEASQILYDSCLIMALQMRDIPLQKDLCRNIYDNYLELGNYRKALEYLTRFYELRDSIKMQEHQTRIEELAMRYENEKKQARILALSNENLEKDLDLRKRTNQRNIYMLGGSGLLVASIFILVFFRNKARHDRMISLQKIRQLENDKKLIAARFIVEGQEEERKRIAKDLHDGLGVLLATARMQFTTIKESKPENMQLIQKANTLLEQAAMDVRRITHNMMPGLLTKYGFFEAVEDLMEKIDDAGGVSANLSISGEPRRFPEKSEIILYRIIQEMAHNTIKHARASNINLDFNIFPNRLYIDYRDDGQGFDVEEMLKKKSIGLTSIQSRVNFLGGKLKIESDPATGTTYQLEIIIN